MQQKAIGGENAFEMLFDFTRLMKSALVGLEKPRLDCSICGDGGAFVGFVTNKKIFKLKWKIPKQFRNNVTKPSN